MDSITFVPSGAPGLYLASTDGQAPAPDTRLALLLPPGAATPPTLSLNDAWAAPGCLLFLAAPLEDAHSFVGAARGFLGERRRQGARLAWIANPGEHNQPLRGRLLEIYQDGSTWRTDRLAQFDVGALTLLVAKGSAIAPADGEIRIAAGPHVLMAPSGTRYPLDAGIALPVGGPAAGTLRCAFTLRNTAIPAGLADLDAGLRTFMINSALEPIDDQSFLTSLRYPLLSESADDWARYAADLTLYPTLDPLAPLDGNRSYCSFVSPAGGPVPAELPSCYRTNLGYTVHLTPRDHLSRLVFATKPAASQPGGSDAYYLTPAGEFAISVPRYTPDASQTSDDNLLCGLSGVEYVKLDHDRTNLLCFYPDHPAFAPGFTLGQTTIGDPAGTLTDATTTSWAYLRQVDSASGMAATDRAPFYYAQPDQAVLYAPPGAGNTSQILDFLEVPSAPLPEPVAPAAPAFPLFPYGGVRADTDNGAGLADYLRLEQQRLVPTRRAQIHAIAQGATVPFPKPQNGITLAEDGATITGTTPQGLLAEFADGYETLRTLYLAKDTADAFLTFERIARGTPLRAALQSNQVFLVISDPDAIKPVFAQHALAIQGWTFDLDPANWAKHGTLLIFKFHDKPMRELADDTQIWALPEQFNKRPAAARRQLGQLLDDALSRVGPDASPKERENYAQLARAASDPNWSGIIALNVSLASGAGDQPAQIGKALPPELAALAGGIDAERFIAQYVGIATTPITPQNGTLVAGQSSLFGLIDYRDDGAPLPSDSGFDFQVTRLQVLFGNSQIKAFASEINVTLDLLFGERTALRNGPGGRNIVVLKGTAEDHNGQTTYAFSFSGDNRFALPDSAVLGEVEIVKAQFTTDPRVPARPDNITGRFTFWGRLNFRRLAKFDVFSFGVEDGADPDTPSAKFLSFANLIVTMSFDQNDPAQRSFVFDPGRLSFDIARSKVRDNSLYAHFPLKFTGLLFSAGDKPLSDYGYMPVKTPLGGAKITSGPWYALTFDLDLGGGGSLAGQVGLVASVLAAWRPGAPGVYVGLHLPGSSGDKREIPLQGILKIVFKSIQFVGPDEDHPTSYLLKLKNIQLKFMVLSIPPSGQTEIIICGDPRPSAAGAPRTLGWYAAYAKEPPPQLPPKASGPA